MNKKPFNIAGIRSGHPFRGTVTTVSNTHTYVVQVRDENVVGSISTQNLNTTELTRRKHPDCLQQGDIIFVAKGTKHFAICVQQLPEKTVCSPIFYSAH